MDLGNVLILQEQPGQSLPGIYDRPNDDAGGGLFTLAFPGPATPCSLDLIDVDPGPDSAALSLVDSEGRRRTYNVPGGWTEDLLLHGPPAFRTLDLRSLDPQPGFGSSATGTQDLGFDGTQVVAIEITVVGSLALDNLSFWPSLP